MRSLVSIQQITGLHLIAGKDRILLATVLGWTVIVKADEFKVGDWCLFYEIDSLLPSTEAKYSFLGKTINYQGINLYRLKTMKMSGVISQGLALPLTMFPEHFSQNSDGTFIFRNKKDKLSIGTDVTELMDVVKYDVDVVESNSSGPTAGKAESSFPSFLRKTDQTRIQSLPHYFHVYKDASFEETLKLDGSSCSMYKVERKLKPTLRQKVLKLFGVHVNATEEHFGVCSRNLEIKKPTGEDSKSDFWKAALKYRIEQHLPVGYCIQGEVIAPNIQKNHEKVKEVEFYIFHVWDIKAQKYLLPKDKREFVAHYLPEAKHVPVIDESIQIFKHNSLSELLERVKGESMNPGTISEGRVYTNVETGESFKVISNDYLLKTGK